MRLPTTALIVDFLINTVFSYLYVMHLNRILIQTDLFNDKYSRDLSVIRLYIRFEKKLK